MKKRALFVGVDEYADGTIADLKHAVDDSEELAAVFRRLLDFERVEKLRNPAGKKDILRKVRELTEGLGKGDLFFFYFAGHGFRVKDNHVLVCAEDAYGDLVDEYDGLPVGQLKKQARGPWNRMLVIDACQNDIRNTRGTAGGISARDLALILEDGAGEESGGGDGEQVVVTSCGEMQRALEVEELGHGLFTSALLETVTAHARARTRLDMAAFRSEMSERMGALAKAYRLEGKQNPLFAMPGDCGIVLLEGMSAAPGAAAPDVDALRAEMERLQAENARLAALAAGRKAEGAVPAPAPRQDIAGGPPALPAKAERKAGKTKTITLPGGAAMEMVWCPATTSGEWKRISGGKDYFLMGSPEDEEGRWNDELQHRVTLTQGFWMAKTPVTQAQWKSVMGNNPSRFNGWFTGGDLPVERVSWKDCREFCRKAGLALPTEAQWEHACRAGTTGPYAGTGRLEDMGWYKDNSGGRTHPAGTKQPNAWGLCDMHGNVWEWCADGYGDYPVGKVTDPKGPVPGAESFRVARGGGWGNYARICRSANRFSAVPGDQGSHLGFRPVGVGP